jgi:hypothetical protein
VQPAPRARDLLKGKTMPPHSLPHPEHDPADLLRRMRCFHEGVLCFRDVTASVRYVLDPASGQPVLPVPAFALESEELALFSPDDALDNPDCLQLLATPTPVDPDRDEACDHFAAYFGKPSHSRWARLEVQSLKRLDHVIDGDLVRLANPLRKHEGALCKLANAHSAAVARACATQTGTAPEHPLVVGVDPWGADVRARFGIIRLEFAQPVSTEAEAQAALAHLLRA